MLCQQKPLKVIDEDLNACGGAVATLHPADADAKGRKNLEFIALMWHLRSARKAGDQAALERVVASGGKNDFLHGYQNWRERSQEFNS